MDTGNALDNTQAWAQHVVRWGTATSGDAVASGDGLIAQMPVFIVTDPHSDVLLAREVSWMIVDAFSALRAAHPDGPLVRHVHDLWRDITRGIARRVAEATILKNGGGIGDVDDVRLAGLIATRIEDRPTWIAVSSGGMGIVTVDEKGAAEPLPQFDDVGYDLPGDLWTIPMEAGQRFVVATERVRAKLTGNQALVALGQLKRAERAASTVLSQAVAGAGTGADQAILVIDVLTPEDEAALASPPTLEGEAEPESDLPASQLSGSWGLEALGIDHSVRPRAPRRSHTAPPVLDDFHFVSYLGSGGFSDVYLYEEQLPKRLVAIKVLSRTALGEGDSSQFRDEVDLMAQLSGHPSVVEIHDANVAESGQPYVVMQYCPMPSLAERLANGPLAIEDALKMGVQVASAVHTAHVMGIVHHDLKPANVLYSQFGRPLLGDFGIATLVGATNQDVMGASLPWAAPEVLLNQQADARADVYSLAATVYTALSGHAPFATDDALTRREYITHMFATQLAPLGLGKGQPQEADAPDNADAYERLDEVLMAAMEREVDKRTATAVEFGRQLQEVQAALGHQPTDLEVPE
jgi:putative non-specific serine/threonine protein kinase